MIIILSFIINIIIIMIITITTIASPLSGSGTIVEWAYTLYIVL